MHAAREAIWEGIWEAIWEAIWETIWEAIKAWLGQAARRGHGCRRTAPG